MYYFLAITLDQNIRDGTFWPAYILCKSWTTSERRSGWRIIRQVDGVPTSNLPRVLVTEILGHEEMIQFMSSYQKMDENGKHFHPKGALCWYSCNKYGDPLGDVIFIKKVPEWRWIYDFANRGFQQLKRTLSAKPKLNEVLSSDVQEEQMKFTDTKMQLHQQSFTQDRTERRRLKNARKKDDDRRKDN